MTIRKPLVFGADGLAQQLQSGDTLNTNAKFTSASTALPTIALLGSQDITITVVPAITGDALAAGEAVTVAMPANMPAGLVIGGIRASATNTVVIRLFATVAFSLGTAVVWTVVAQR